MAHIRLRGVGVDIPVYDGRSRSLKVRLFGAVAQKVTNPRLASGPSGIVVVRALRDVDLAFEDGDRVGLIGRNGAGKSTLLKVLSGIYEPTSGTLESSGRVVSLLDLMLGMDDDATGHQNIDLRAMMLGASPEEIEAARPGIVDFCELGDYLDLPVRTYSSGMKLRLAFAVSTAFHPDILLMDEVIGVGDAGFVHKAHERLRAFGERASILVLSSHSTDIVREFCDRAIWLDEGRVRMNGPVDEVIDAYEGKRSDAAA